MENVLMRVSSSSKVSAGWNKSVEQWWDGGEGGCGREGGAGRTMIWFPKKQK